MSKGVIIHLDDKADILKSSENIYNQLGIDLTLKLCQNKEEFDSAIAEHAENIKCLIFDLCGESPGKDELEGDSMEFLDHIEKNFACYNVPIFIYSGHLDNLRDKFNNNGTVFKIDKENGLDIVFEKIKLFLECGFLDVFGPGGLLEAELKKELHKSFVNQFSKGEQIEELIKSIIFSNQEGDCVERVKTVFKRITVKSLSSDLLAPIADSEDTVNPIEHFYKRQSKLKIWTGDIWKPKAEGNESIIVLTPRCDFATGKANSVLYCIITSNPKIDLSVKNIRNYLTDNLLGKATRYIPSTVFFPGGMVNLAIHHTTTIEEFLSKYDYVVTLSDDLTNEIIGKFAYYFLRTGITNINEHEFEAVLKVLSSNNAKPVD